VLILSVNFAPIASTAQVSPVKQHSNNWQLAPNHLSVNCLDATESRLFPQPNVKDLSGQAVSLSNEDQYFSLASASAAWINYFNVSRWETIKIKGDGGVDVTGAPNAILVEGANSALVNIAAESVMQFQIAIPADGYIAFDYENFGGSNLLNTVFSVQVNDLANVQKTAKGKFFSSLLHRGDVLTLQVESAVAPAQLQIANLRFFTNAAGVWERHWTATNTDGQSIDFLQFITIEKASIADILFPDDVFYTQTEAYEIPSCTDPVCTGFPFVDKDGNISTSNDRMMIDHSACDFAVSWSDDLLQEAGQCVIKRHWTIRDQASGNTSTAVQYIHLWRCPDLEMSPEQAIPVQTILPKGYDTQFHEIVAEKGNDL